MIANLLLVLAGVLSSWVVLAVLGAERQRRLQDADAARRAAQAVAAALEAAKKAQAATTTRQPAR